MTTYRIAVIPGDGIGREVVPEGVRVLEAAGASSIFLSSGMNFLGAVNIAPSTAA